LAAEAWREQQSPGAQGGALLEAEMAERTERRDKAWADGRTFP
jgi:hypothetical protein